MSIGDKFWGRVRFPPSRPEKSTYKKQKPSAVCLLGSSIACISLLCSSFQYIMSSSLSLSSVPKKRAAVSIAAAADTNESGTKHEGKRRMKEHDQKPSGDPHEKLAASLKGKADALAAIESARRRLQMFQTMKKRRAMTFGQEVKPSLIPCSSSETTPYP